MSTGMGSWRMKPSPGAAGGRTNRFDGAGWASDGSRIPPGGYGDSRGSSGAAGQRQQMTQYGVPGGMTPSRPGPGRPSAPMMQSYNPGQATPQQSPAPYGRPRPRNQADNPRNPGGTTPQQASQPDLTQYMAPGSPLGRPANPRPPGSPAVQSPGQAQPQQSPYAGSSPYGQAPMAQVSPAPYLPLPAGGVGNWGNQTQGRPAPFSVTGSDPFGGWGGMDQFLGQRAAFVNNINQHRGMTASQGLPPTPMNFNQMWNQAGQMQQQGWQNPLQGLFG